VARPSSQTRAKRSGGRARQTPVALWSLLRAAARQWWQDDVFQLAAALAFYTIFSMAPIVTIALWIAGIAFGTDAATRALVEEVGVLIGPNGAAVVESVIQGVSHSKRGLVSSVVAIATSILGSTAVFAQLQKSLNRIWDVKPQPGRSAIWRFVTKRLLSFGLVLSLGFMLLVSLVASALLTALQDAVSTSVPLLSKPWRVVDLAVSFALLTLLFSAVYRFLPDARVAWRDVVVGGAATAALFSIGKLAIGLYLGRASLGSAYGAAGSFVVLVVWVYYSAIVCFLGAEFTQVYAHRYGSHIRPSAHAVRLGEKDESVEPA
jgi:membrane protein